MGTRPEMEGLSLMVTSRPTPRYRVGWSQGAAGLEKWLNAQATCGYVLHSAYPQVAAETSEEIAHNGMWVIMEIEQKGNEDDES